MTTVRSYHRQAMERGEEAQQARKRGSDGDALQLYSRAADLEVQAANLVTKARESEPTRSILYLGAASLAFKAKELDRSEQLAGEALSGYPTRQTRADLLELLEEVDYIRRSNELLASLGDARVAQAEGAPIAMRLRGPEVGFGRVPIHELLPRLDGFGKILDRFARRMLGQSYQSSGPTPREFSLYQPIVQAFAPGSFKVEIELSPRPNGQLTLPEIIPSSFEIVESAATCISAVEQGDDETVRRVIGDEKYLKNFMSHVREIAPDGELIRAVEVTTPSRVLSLTRTQDQIGMPRSSSPQLDADLTVLVSQPTSLEGKLLMGDARKDKSQTVIVVQDDESEATLVVEEGLEEIVRSLFGYRVAVEIAYQGRINLLQDIRRVD